MVSKRYAKVNIDRCVSCGACSKVCPKMAISVLDGCFARVDMVNCVGCGKCQKICPADCIEMGEREAI